MGRDKWDFSKQLAEFGPDRVTHRLDSLDQAQAYCRFVAQSHYENFQIVSRLLPRLLRQDFHNIYAYCRWSDDLADETANRQQATALLGWWQAQLDHLFTWQASQPTDAVLSSAALPPLHPVMQALGPTIIRHNLPKQPFDDLLSAFVQDQSTSRYDSFVELNDYCRRSANPVGRLVLGLARAADDPENLRLSDEICTGLQLANFCQDMQRDAAMGRIYAPRELWGRHGVDESMLMNARVTPQLRQMLREFVQVARGRLDAGAMLAARVPRWLALDVRLFRAGGLAILREIERQNFDVWTRRPTVSKWHKIRLLIRACVARA
ncbi:MAG: squalene synthase HpnC [Pirellulaceae bacterium]|nr:squalene synthase HpnC [Pirellulaceae bacterium]